MTEIRYKLATWDLLLDYCSRLHTTRRRPEGPWENAAMREDAKALEVVADGTEATVVPTRMHEPGFYVRSRNGAGEDYWNWRSDQQLETFHRMVDDGRVFFNAEVDVSSAAAARMRQEQGW